MGRLQSKSLDAGTVTSSNLTYDSSVSSGSLLIVAGGSGGGTTQPTSVSDDVNGSHTIDRKQGMTTDTATVWIASRANSGSGTTTVTVSQASGTFRWAIVEYNNMATSSVLDQVNSAEGTATSVSSGNITTTQANEVLIGVSRNSNIGTWTATTNFSIIHAVPSGGGSQRFVVEERIVSATGTYNSAPDDGGTDNKGTVIASYKAAAGGGLVQRHSMSDELQRRRIGRSLK